MLFDAIAEGNQETVRSLIQDGVDINTRDLVGWTPLMVAAAQGSISTVQILIEAGADINAKTREGQTALNIAAQSANTFTLALLRDAGAVAWFPSPVCSSMLSLRETRRR